MTGDPIDPVHTSPGILQTGLNTTWISGGRTVPVHTDPERGESDAALLLRHTAAVKAEMLVHPMDH